MARTHPPTLITLVSRTLREECRVRSGDKLLVAVSGGGDSVALLHVLSILRRRLKFELFAHGVDHGLREAAARELDAVDSLCARLAVDFSRSRCAVAPGSNLQARARHARYAALRARAVEVGANALATAHHADDRAETVLIRVLRGADIWRLGVLAARAERDGVDVIRPMLRARHADVRAHLERHRLTYVLDPSNQDRRFLRVRVRQDVMPLLESLSPGIVGHLNALADQALAARGPSERAASDVSLEMVARSPIVDESGQPLRLGRAQREQLARAIALRQRGARIRVSGGREIRLDAKTLTPRVTRAAGIRGRS